MQYDAMLCVENMLISNSLAITALGSAKTFGTVGL
jgi:hypothetical protein